MSHETIHELLCLRLYGELDADEARALEQHLATCAECRAFEAELGRGLGALAAARSSAAAAGPEPADGDERGFRQRLEARLRPAPPRRAAVGLAFAAGLAAGMLVAVLLGRPDARDAARDPGEAAVVRVASNAAAAGAPVFDGPPPAATSRGVGALVAAGRRR